MACIEFLRKQTSEVAEKCMEIENLAKEIFNSAPANTSRVIEPSRVKDCINLNLRTKFNSWIKENTLETEDVL